MKGALGVKKHMGEDGDTNNKKKMDIIEEALKDRDEDLEAMEALNQALIVKERRSNEELQQARKELINVSTYFIPTMCFSIIIIIMF